MWLPDPQVAEVISDVREPIMDTVQPVDENMSRRQQVQVRKIFYNQRSQT